MSDSNNQDNQESVERGRHQKHYPLVMTNIAMDNMALIEIDALPL